MLPFSDMDSFQEVSGEAPPKALDPEPTNRESPNPEHAAGFCIIIRLTPRQKGH